MKIILLCGLVVAMVACVSPYKEPSGTYIKAAHTEFRSPFGTNDSFARLQRCDGPTKTVLFYLDGDFSNCVLLTKAEQDEWVHGYSQGQGGQIVSGAMNAGAVGAIAGTQAGGNAAASAASTVTTTVIAPRTPGHRR